MRKHELGEGQIFGFAGVAKPSEAGIDRFTLSIASQGFTDNEIAPDHFYWRYCAQHLPVHGFCGEYPFVRVGVHCVPEFPPFEGCISHCKPPVQTVPKSPQVFQDSRVLAP